MALGTRGAAKKSASRQREVLAQIGNTPVRKSRLIIRGHGSLRLAFASLGLGLDRTGRATGRRDDVHRQPSGNPPGTVGSRRADRPGQSAGVQGGRGSTHHGEFWGRTDSPVETMFVFNVRNVGRVTARNIIIEATHPTSGVVDTTQLRKALAPDDWDRASLRFPAESAKQRGRPSRTSGRREWGAAAGPWRRDDAPEGSKQLRGGRAHTQRVSRPLSAQRRF